MRKQKQQKKQVTYYIVLRVSSDLDSDFGHSDKVYKPVIFQSIEDAKKHALELYEMYDFDDEQITEIYSRIQGRKTISKKLEALKQHHLEYSNPKYIEVIEIHPAPFHKAKKK